MSTLLALSLAMVGGLILSRVVKFFHLPNVTGYLIAGLLIGPYCFKVYSVENVQAMKVINTVALGFIAFSIGGEFKLSYLKQLGRSITVITFLQAIAAAGFVICGLFVLKAIMPDQMSTPLALLLGAIATATAPAATLMVVRQYKAKGPVTDALLPVVAFDDAIGLMVFSVCFALAKMFASGAAVTFNSIVVQPVLEIVFSLLVGGGIGAILGFCMRWFKSSANRLCLMICATALGVALSDLLALSSLLTCMAVGAVFANMRGDSAKIISVCDSWTPPLFMLFFVISGAELDLTVIPYVGIVGIAYIVLRSAGKYLGARAGATIVHADRNIQKYLGVALLPQAGVAIGMAQMVANEPLLAEYAPKVVTVVLAATLFYELVGPLLTKIALKRAGEIVNAAENNPFAVFKKQPQPIPDGSPTIIKK